MVKAGTSRVFLDAPHDQPKNWASAWPVDWETSIEAPSTHPPAPRRNSTSPVWPKPEMAINPVWLIWLGEIEWEKNNVAPPIIKPNASNDPSAKPKIAVTRSTTRSRCVQRSSRPPDE